MVGGGGGGDAGYRIGGRRERERGQRATGSQGVRSLRKIYLFLAGHQLTRDRKCERRQRVLSHA